MSCTHCHTPTAEGITLCDRHEADLRRLLSDMPGVLEDADDTIAKLDQLGGGAGTNDPAAGSAAPLNLEASARKRTLTDAIHSWARTILEDDTDPGLSGVEPVTYLRLSIDQIKKRDDAGELLREISEATRYLLVAIDLPPEWITLGRCATVIDGHQCPDTIRAERGRPEARCRTCGETYSVAAVQAGHIDQAWEHYAPLPVVVRSLRHTGFKISERSAQRWVQNGELLSTRSEQDGTPLYTLTEVKKFAQDMRARHGGKRMDKERQVA